MGAQTTKPAAYELSGDAKREAVRELFGQIAPRYDLLNRIMSVRGDLKWRRLAVASIAPQPGETALDLCCGTGDFLPILRHAIGPEGKLFGADFCLPMLSRAETKDGHGADLILADATRLPFPDSAFDVVTVGWGIRNVPDMDQAHSEIARILRPGGRFVSLDMSRPENRVIEWGGRLASSKILPFLGSLFGMKNAYSYLQKSTERFATRQEIKASMERAGIAQVSWRNLALGAICMHMGVKA